jgi:hypothetical protein
MQAQDSEDAIKMPEEFSLSKIGYQTVHGGKEYLNRRRDVKHSNHASLKLIQDL